MTIGSLKELDKLILLCRKRGIEYVKVDNLEFKLGDSVPVTIAPTKQYKASQELDGLAPGGVTDTTKIISDELSYDQLLFYSSQGSDTPDLEGN